MELTAALLETVEDCINGMGDYMSFTDELVGKLLAAAEVDADFAMGYCLIECLRLFGGLSAANLDVTLGLPAAQARKLGVTLSE